MSLLSETAPPPRNPKLQYCLEDYTATRFVSHGGEFDNAIASARGMDLSTLPESMASALEKSFEQATTAKTLLAQAIEAEQAVKANESAYRGVHTIVRGIEAQIRDIEELADELDTLRSRVKGLSLIHI